MIISKHLLLILISVFLLFGCQSARDEFYNNGVDFGDSGKFHQAISSYNKAIEIDPEFFKAYYNRGTMNLILSEYDKAIEDFNKAIVLQPECAECYCCVTLWRK